MRLSDYLSDINPDDAYDVTETLDAYGVYIEDNTTYLGSGSYKEVHSTNIPGVVMFITTYPETFDDERFILDLMAESDYPAMEYYSVEEIGGVILALGKRLYHTDHDWDENRLRTIREKVEDLLYQMIDDEFFFSDLQFMVDENDQPVFTDPLSISSRDSACWCGAFHLEATCKHPRSNLYATAQRRV